MWETWVQSLRREDPLEKEMATHSSILAWRIPWTEEPGGLQSTGSQTVGHDWATSLTQICIYFSWFHLVGGFCGFNEKGYSLELRLCAQKVENTGEVHPLHKNSSLRWQKRSQKTYSFNKMKEVNTSEKKKNLLLTQPQQLPRQPPPLGPPPNAHWFSAPTPDP